MNEISTEMFYYVFIEKNYYSLEHPPWMLSIVESGHRNVSREIAILPGDGISNCVSAESRLKLIEIPEAACTPK
jgi:hypothetical protein